jgi:hypothetical protein
MIGWVLLLVAVGAFAGWAVRGWYENRNNDCDHGLPEKEHCPICDVEEPNANEC